jgi:hypothetical protein
LFERTGFLQSMRCPKQRLHRSEIVISIQTNVDRLCLGIVVKAKLFFLLSIIDQNDGSMNDGSIKIDRLMRSSSVQRQVAVGRTTLGCTRSMSSTEATKRPDVIVVAESSICSR